MKTAWPLLIIAIILIAYFNIDQTTDPNKYTLSRADILGSAMHSLRHFGSADMAIEERLGSGKRNLHLARNSGDGYTSDAVSDLPMAIEVYVEQNGERRLTDATATLYDFYTGGVETYELLAKRNDIVIAGEPDTPYELIVEKEGYWPSSTYFTYGQLEEKLLEIVLMDSASAPGPAVVFDPSATIFYMQLQFMDTGSVVLDWRNGNPQDTIQFAVDPNNEIGTAFFSREMGYVLSLPRARITGDVHLIRGIYFDAEADGLDVRAATGLEILSLSGGSMQGLDLSANAQLRSLSMLSMGPMNEFVLPEQHHINNLVISGAGFPTETQLDYAIENVYSNAVTQNILSGRIELYDTPVSAGSASKLRALKTSYGWEVVVTPPIEEPNGIEDFSVVDIRNGNKLLNFLDSVTLDLGHPDFNNWSIQANTHPAEIGSVVFKIDVQKKNIENEAPYLLAGYHLRSLSPTPHILEAEAYSERLGRGSRIQTRAALIKFTNNTTVSSLTVLDGEGGWVQELDNGDTIDAGSALMRNFNIEALLSRESDRGSVQFYVNGELFWTENRAPYIMVPGNRKWWEAPGEYTITAVPYSKRNGGGLEGTPRTVTFTISEIAAADNSSIAIHTAADTDEVVSIYPVPVKDVLYLIPGREFTNQEAIVVISDQQGQVLLKNRINMMSQPCTLEIDKLQLQNGMYYLQLITRDASKKIRFVKE